MALALYINHIHRFPFPHCHQQTHHSPRCGHAVSREGMAEQSQSPHMQYCSVLRTCRPHPAFPSHTNTHAGPRRHTYNDSRRPHVPHTTAGQRTVDTQYSQVTGRRPRQQRAFRRHRAVLFGATRAAGPRALSRGRPTGLHVSGLHVSASGMLHKVVDAEHLEGICCARRVVVIARALGHT
jgi:hypothetical protein